MISLESRIEYGAITKTPFLKKQLPWRAYKGAATPELCKDRVNVIAFIQHIKNGLLCKSVISVIIS